MEPYDNRKRLAAILAADVAGYTRLVEEDTEATVNAWKAARDEVVPPIVSTRGGRIVKFTGDGFLAEFHSVENAVAAAIEAQTTLAESPLNFRMGIHLGDVMDDGQDIHGEGVNIAARLEALAEAGGINLSGMVHEAVRNRIDTAFEDIGEYEVKNVSAPIRIYRVAIPPSSRDNPMSTPAALQQEKPSVAVMPFDNMSSDAEQDCQPDRRHEDENRIECKV